MSTETTPILAPIVKLLNSRKFIIVLTYIIVNFIIRAIPSLTPWVDSLTIVISAGLGAIFLHLSQEDLIKARATYTPTSLADAVNQAVTEAVGTLVPLPPAPAATPPAANAPAISG